MITKDQVIKEILEKNPEKTLSIAHTLAQAGVHCIGCHSSAHETLEDGLKSHGKSEQEITQIVDKLNKVLTEPNKKDADFHITENAAKEIKEHLEKEKALRLSVTSGGCSGIMYDLEIADKPQTSDLTKEIKGIKVYIDKNSIPFLDRVALDFLTTDDGSGFVFRSA